MRRSDAVIGAGFGDEGKGLVTDWLAAGLGMDAIVTRFNSGAQAKHTVQLPDGRRHAFSHFGSGSFNGASTYLSRYFVCNPLLFLREKAKLQTFGVAPVVHVDEDCLITTPYDIMINQIVEEARRQKRHGSCGLGFGETIERNHYPSYAFTFRDLHDRRTLRKKLQNIRQGWILPRLQKLGVTQLSEEWRERLHCEQILDCYLVNVEQFIDYVVPASIELLQRNRPIIFEGAAGLLLDQDKGWFPHVTRSNTGLKNVMALAQAAGIDRVDIIYVTRPYTTRHGAGPLPHELQMPPYARMEDETNTTNLYQGQVRYGWLDLDLLVQTILNDMQDKISSIAVQHRIAVTCMDHVDDRVTFIADARLQSIAPEFFLQQVLQSTHAERGLLSYGPTRLHVEPFTGIPRKSKRYEDVISQIA